MSETKQMSTGESFAVGAVCAFAMGALGLVVGQNVSAGEHSYHDFRIVSVIGSTVVRAVESPAAVDDKVIETIIDGKLISRTHPEHFEAIWEKAK